MTALLVGLLAISQGAAPAPEAVGQACATCHAAQANSYPKAQMAHALEPVTECSILRNNPILTFSIGQYSYWIERKGEQSIYTVSDGRETISAPLAWAFGLGAAGQTYAFEIDGAVYESRVSYFREIGRLALTLGAEGANPQTLLEAAGRPISRSDQVRCFGCHATNAFKGKELTLTHMTPGVQCERCHGAAKDHLAGLKSGDMQLARMKALGSGSTEQISNFCGQCHRTWAEIAGGGGRGVVNVRFQPYGLTNSKCYDTEDRRISCVACHNPHEELNRNLATYDPKCQACHSAGGKATARICKVAVKDCVTCHMPKVDLPGAHHRFTDHEIHIARPRAKPAA